MIDAERWNGWGWECVDSHPFWAEVFADTDRFWPLEIEDFEDFAAKRMQGYWRHLMHADAASERGKE